MCLGSYIMHPSFICFDSHIFISIQSGHRFVFNVFLRRFIAQYTRNGHMFMVSCVYDEKTMQGAWNAEYYIAYASSCQCKHIYGEKPYWQSLNVMLSFPSSRKIKHACVLRTRVCLLWLNSLAIAQLLVMKLMSPWYISLPLRGYFLQGDHQIINTFHKTWLLHDTRW